MFLLLFLFWLLLFLLVILLLLFSLDTLSTNLVFLFAFLIWVFTLLNLLSRRDYFGLRLLLWLFSIFETFLVLLLFDGLIFDSEGVVSQWQFVHIKVLVKDVFGGFNIAFLLFYVAEHIKLLSFIFHNLSSKPLVILFFSLWLGKSNIVIYFLLRKSSLLSWINHLFFIFVFILLFRINLTQMALYILREINLLTFKDIEVLFFVLAIEHLNLKGKVSLSELPVIVVTIESNLISKEWFIFNFKSFSLLLERHKRVNIDYWSHFLLLIQFMLNFLLQYFGIYILKVLFYCLVTKLLHIHIRGKSFRSGAAEH